MIGWTVGQEKNVSRAEHGGFPGEMIPDGAGEPQDQPVRVIPMEGCRICNALNDAEKL